MAYASISQSGSTNVLYAYANVNEVSSSGNYRTIYLSLYVVPNDGFSGSRDAKKSFNCGEANYSYSNVSDVINGNGMWLYEGQFSVYVPPGHTSASLNLSFSASLYSSTAGGWRTINGSISAITGLSLVADATISSASNVYFGNKCSVSWTPSASSFSYRLKFTMGSYSHTTDIISPNTTNVYTYSDLTIPLSAATNIPNSTYGTMTVSLTQYKDASGSETIGSAGTSTFRVTLKDDVIPSISTYNASIDNSANPILDSWGVALVGYSKIHLSASASGVYGSTIKSFSISGDYKTSISGTSLDYTGGAISSSGNKSFLITCTDSRGRTSRQVTTNIINVLPYTLPKLTELTTTKETYADDDVSNDRMVVTATWEYDPIGGHNSAYGTAYYKESSASDWTQHSGTVKNATPFTLTNLVLDETKSYNFKVVVKDAVGGKSDKSSFSSTTTVLLDFKAGGDGLGVGKICEKARMEVSMDALFYNNVSLMDDAKEISLSEYIRKVAYDAIYPIGAIYMSLNPTHPSRIFGGEWVEISGRFLIGANSEYEVDKTGGQAQVTLTVDEIPSHNHGLYGFTDTVAHGGGIGTGYAIITDYVLRANVTANTGLGKSHDNIPPWFAVYMWKRTA